MRKIYDPPPYEFKVDINYPEEYMHYPLSKPITWGDMMYLYVAKSDFEDSGQTALKV